MRRQRVNGNGNKYTRKLALLQQQYEQQLAELLLLDRAVTEARANEQVLLDMISHTEHARAVRQGLDTAIQQLQQQEQHAEQGHLPASAQLPPGCSSGHDSSSGPASFSNHVLDSITPALALQAQRQWTRQAIMAIYADCVYQLLPALEIAERPEGYTSPAAAESLRRPAMQQLEQAVAGLARVILLCCVWAEHFILPVVEATSCNLCTQQPETPDVAFWRSAVQRAQLQQWQIDHLMAAFAIFVRMRSSAAAAGASVSQLCTQVGALLLAHAADGPAAAGAGAGTSAVATPAAAAGAGAAEAAAPAVPAAGMQLGEASGSLDGELQSYKLRLMSATRCLYAIYLNTLSPMQLARLAVAAFPYIVRPAAVVEALIQLQSEQQQVTMAAAWAAGSDSAAAGSTFAANLDEHSRARQVALLQLQQLWLEQQQQQGQQEL